jgi:hypothetical protein
MLPVLVILGLDAAMAAVLSRVLVAPFWALCVLMWLGSAIYAGSLVAAGWRGGHRRGTGVVLSMDRRRRLYRHQEDA